MGSPPLPCTAPQGREPPRPTYLVHAHAGINPIGQVRAFGFAPRVHIEPSSPERVAVPGAPCAHMGKSRAAAAAAAQGNSPSVTHPHGISHGRAGSRSRAPSRSLCRHRAATECLCADPVCSVCTLPVRSMGDPLLEREQGVNPCCPLIRGGRAGRALRVTWCALCRECRREQRGCEPWTCGKWQHHCLAFWAQLRATLGHGDPSSSWGSTVGCFALGSRGELREPSSMHRDTGHLPAELPSPVWSREGMQKAGQPPAQALPWLVPFIFPSCLPGLPLMPRCGRRVSDISTSRKQGCV